jgi:hypothetical protein
LQTHAAMIPAGLSKPLQAPGDARKKRKTTGQDLRVLIAEVVTQVVDGHTKQRLQVIGYAVFGAVSVLSDPSAKVMRDIARMPVRHLRNAQNYEALVEIEVSECFHLETPVLVEAASHTPSVKGGFKLSRDSYDVVARSIVRGSGLPAGSLLGHTMKSTLAYKTYDVPPYARQAMQSREAFSWLMFQCDARKLGRDVQEQAVDFEPPHLAGVQDDGSDDEDPSLGAPSDTKRRTSGHDFFLYLELVSLLKSPSSLRSVLNIAAELFGGLVEGVENLTQQVEELHIPDRMAIRRASLKLDFCKVLWSRHCWDNGCKCAISWHSDSSGQQKLFLPAVGYTHSAAACNI